MLKNHAKSDDCKVIEARSNISITLDRLMAVFGGLCALSLLIVVWPVMLGLWPILIAALVHLLIVGWCFRNAWRGNWAREIFRVNGETLTVEYLRAGHRAQHSWPVAWTRVVTEIGRFGELHVFLSSQGRRLEIGAFLPVGEREQLAGLLDQALGPRSAWSSTKLIQVG